MDKPQNKKQEEIKEEADQQPAETSVAKEAAKEVTPVEIEAPKKVEELEAPKEELIEAKEEDGIVSEAESPDKGVAPAENVVLQDTEEKVEAEDAETETKVKDTEEKEKTPKTETPVKTTKGNWYIVHTYSGHENKVAKSLHQRIESMGFEERIFEIIVPTRDTVKVSQGKKENVKEKIFPGYVLVRMILDDESWLLVRTTQGVTAFIGAGNKPTPISDKEVQAIQKFMQTEEPLYRTAFTVGEAVKIVDGPFSDFLGTIDNIDEAKGKLKVLVSIFGRETPVELDFLQVSKL